MKKRKYNRLAPPRVCLKVKQHDGYLHNKLSLSPPPLILLPYLAYLPLLSAPESRLLLAYLSALVPAPRLLY